AACQWSQGLARWCQALPSGLWQGQPSGASLALRQRWTDADQAVQRLLDQQLGPQAPLSEPALARALSRLLPAELPVVLANSSPVRDWESVAATEAAARPVISFRGASGIDGTLSSACGVAEALGQAVLLTGDLALLHDSNGWLWQQQLQGRLAVVLINNGGGGIFEQLPIRHTGSDPGQPSSLLPAMDFERLFAMPQAVDVALLCTAHGVPHRCLEQLQELQQSLAWALGQRLAVLELRTDRRADAALRARLRTMASELVAKR
ncbi:MAG: 2-succinyl-5-enolpyruvyl-6-hydroxy-3-cyclohexene-1-carboxylate synthase, partial [Cyanobacteria bacterium M_surface_7_m2_040]|nr:2-succinyl-5-enolpyruvyl-6-hydroxy-3-cyclohexene-1-carboxylate synthase [Cyanobacteria bacterium M_surface_7_m2_040]